MGGEIARVVGSTQPRPWAAMVSGAGLSWVMFESRCRTPHPRLRRMRVRRSASLSLKGRGECCALHEQVCCERAMRATLQITPLPLRERGAVLGPTPCASAGEGYSLLPWLLELEDEL